MSVESSPLRQRMRAFIREAADLLGWKPTQLARAAKVAPSTINRFLNDDDATHIVGTKTLVAITEAVSAEIARREREDPEGKRVLRRGWQDLQSTIPLPTGSEPVMVIGAVQAGVYGPAETWPDSEQYASRLLPDPRFPAQRQFALEVRGPSINQIYPERSQVLCIKFIDLGERRPPRPGDLVVVQRRLAGTDDYEATIKLLKQAADGSFWVWPQSDDPEFQAPWKLEAADEGSADNDDLLCSALVIGGYRAEGSG